MGPATGVTPAKMEKYTRQNSYLYPCQNIAFHANNKRQPWKTPTSNPLLHTHAGVHQTPVIHTHVVERLDSNKMRLHDCICTPTRVCIYMYMYTYTQTHIHACTNICTCTHTRIHAHTHTYACICTPIHRQKISATTPQRLKQYHRRTYVSIYICMRIHIYMHIHICAQPAASVSQMCTLKSNKYLYNVYVCTCTSA